MTNQTLHIDATVIGAGVIGLAIARALAKEGQQVVVVEQERCIGHHTSSRNSEVIHAGIYYPKDSLKAKHCVDGKQRLYDYCQEHQVPYRQCGKLIVATEAHQISQLHQLIEKAKTNHVSDLIWLPKEAITDYEPTLKGEAALLSPSTGILDTQAYLLALQGDIERHGGHVILNSQIVGGYANNTPRNQTLSKNTHRLLIESSTEGQTSQYELYTNQVVNCSGLFASQLLKTISGFPKQHIPTLQYAKGSYFKLQGKAPFSRLIYPVPEKGGLGVHLTLDMTHQARFGPDVEWLEHFNEQLINHQEIPYAVDPDRAKHFYSAIRRYWPDLKDGQLSPDYSGIRPKLDLNKGLTDFSIHSMKDHGVNGWINLLGIESPGLTSSLSLAEEVCTILRAH